MFHSISGPSAGTVASVCTITVATFVAGLVAFSMSGVLEVKAEPKITVAAHPKADRRPVAWKGTACSQLGWPNYEKSCQFDMRRPADEMQQVRIIALR